ncbi:MAG: hypothetical protein Q8O30_03815 [Candidatus Omnitrophota bacterium]|nr:hypothetical protein [Candidatus Omnitrophota bacterium]
MLIGGQACIIYGAAEFSRDSDFVVLSSNDNLGRLEKALSVLRAELIYVPPLEADYLERGHACHFRCKAKDVQNLRVDVISKLRGCEPFDKLWERKKTVSLKGGNAIDVIGLKDLVQSKKTQRDKDWLMLKRLIENDIILNKDNPLNERVRWWFLESRSPDSLVRLAKEYPEIIKECVAQRPLLSATINIDIQKLNSQLYEEELIERQKDTEYWAPLKKELEMLRHK